MHKYASNACCYKEEILEPKEKTDKIYSIEKKNKLIRKNIKERYKIFLLEKMKSRKIYVILNYFILIYFIFIDLFFESNERNFQVTYSYITLKTNGSGKISILSEKFSANYPDEIYINARNQTEIKKIYYLEYEINNFKLIWKKKLSKTGYIFYNCTKIIEIDLSNFDSSLISSMSSMFSGCSSLRSLNLTNLVTAQVTDMSSMFSGCSSLKSLDLNNLDTGKVTKMNSMFSGCSSISSLDLNNFNTLEVKYMSFMFSGCSSLMELNLNNFNTIKITDIRSMFRGCSSLSYLNLSNFNLSAVSKMEDMFNGCTKLAFIDFKSPKLYSAISQSNIFFNKLFYLKICNETEDYDLYSKVLKKS